MSGGTQPDMMPRRARLASITQRSSSSAGVRDGLEVWRRPRSLARGGMVGQALNAHQIGATARERLHDPDRAWSVLASVTGAIYLESDSGDILWIAANASALHQRAILLPHLPTDLPPAGSTCAIDVGCLRVGEDLVVGTSEARVWLPEALGQEGVFAPGLMKRTAAAIERIALCLPPTGVFARVAFSPVTGDFRCSREMLGAQVLSVADRAVASLCRISLGRALPEALDQVTGLVGLGEGLTPSGDDVLGGFLFTLRTLDSILQGRLEIDWPHVETWLRRVEGRTNRISFCILADHARGEATAPLAEFVQAIAVGSSQERVEGLGARVARIGQSSGWELLAGVYCACSAITRIMDRPSDGQNADPALQQRDLAL